MNLGNKLIKLRKKEKLSQESLAEILGVTRQTISNWELNITKPDINQIKKISETFNISIDDLLDNNIRDILEKKITNTEKLTNKSTKNIRIIIITLYFIILSSIILYTIHILSKKDFTNKNQLEISCILEEQKIFMTLEMNGENEIITDYILVLTEYEDDKNYFTEKFSAGNSLAEAIDSLTSVKEIILGMGATCK